MICMYERCTKWKDFGAIRLKTNEVHTACGYYRTLKMEGNEKQKKSKISGKEKESKKKKLSGFFSLDILIEFILIK